MWLVSNSPDSSRTGAWPEVCESDPLDRGLPPQVSHGHGHLDPAAASIRTPDFKSARHQSVRLQYLDDGDVPIRNDWVENLLRPIALETAHCLFAGSLRAGKRSAISMSLLHAARINGHDPCAYLKDRLERLRERPTADVYALRQGSVAPKSARSSNLISSA